jgi:fatty-acid desaturase
MTTTTAVAFVATVLVLSCLAGFIAWLNRGNQGRSQNCVQTYPHSHVCYLYGHSTNCTCVSHNHDDQYATVDHNHDQHYSPVGHGHDDQYSAIGHDHDGRYASHQHSHNEYLTRDEMDRQLTGIRRQLTIMNTTFAQSPLGILLGVLFGGVLGAIVGVILDLVLPRSIFAVNATTTYNVGGQQIVQHLTSYDSWPKWGIVLGCIVVGMLLGGLTMFFVGLFRSRRQSTTQA